MLSYWSLDRGCGWWPGIDTNDTMLLFSPSVVSDSMTPWTVAHQAPLSMRFPWQESWSGLPFPPPGLGLGFPTQRVSQNGVCALSHSVLSYSLRPHGLQPTRFPCPWDSPGTNTGVGCHFFPQGIFLAQKLNPCLLCLLHCRLFFTAESPGKPKREIYIWDKVFKRKYLILVFIKITCVYFQSLP